MAVSKETLSQLPQDGKHFGIQALHIYLVDLSCAMLKL